MSSDCIKRVVKPGEQKTINVRYNMPCNTPSHQFCTSSHIKSAGFTLIELLIVVAIAGILMAIAVPSYTSFIERSKMRAAQGDLASLSVNIENQYQRLLSYPTLAANDDVNSKYSGWNPTSPDSVFTFSAVSATASYTLTATGQGSLSGCVITLTHDNVRNTTSCPQGDGDWI